MAEQRSPKPLAGVRFSHRPPMKESFPKKENNNYEYFNDPIRRKDIYQFSKGVTEYLHSQKIPNLILIDRSPRPLWVGIDEYWKSHYKKEKRPNIYFVNPDGLDVASKIASTTKLTVDQLLFDRLMLAVSGESIIQKEGEKIKEELKEKFKEAYSKLELDKNKPLAVFDNCIHSGETMLNVLNFLDSAGYEKLKVLIGETSGNWSNVKIDKDFTKKVQYVSCGAFGRDLGITKDRENVFSKYDENADREKVVKCREEIRRIVKEKGK